MGSLEVSAAQLLSAGSSSFQQLPGRAVRACIALLDLLNGGEASTAEILLIGSVVAGRYVTGLRCSVVQLQTVA